MDATPSVSPGELSLNLFKDSPGAETAENAVNHYGIQATESLCKHLEQKQCEATARALQERREQDEIGKFLLPPFLQANGERPDVDPALAKMQTLKNAAMEHVRWRSLRAPEDMYTVSIFSTMRAVVRTWSLAEFSRTHATRHLEALRGTPGVPGSASATPEEFLAAAHKRSSVSYTHLTLPTIYSV